MKLALTEQIKKYVFPEFSSGKSNSCYLVSGKVLVTERMPATSLFHFCLFPSSDGSRIPDHSFILGTLKKKCFGIFVSLAITYAVSGVQSSLKYSGGLQGLSKTTFMPGLPVNGKHDCSAPDFAHMPCFTVISELTLCSPHDEMFTFISLSLPYMLSEVSL
jgi:hypothetical protein